MSLIHCQTDRRHFCVYMKFFIIFIRRAYYAKTKFQEFIFTLITSGCMIFIMGVYNVAIHTGELQAATFTVCTMVPLMSLLGTIESSGITSNLIFIWLQTICLNFIMAYPLQILVVGPFCRFIFRHLFASTNQGNESKVEYEMEQQGFAE